MLYNGLQYVIQHPFVNDPLRPGKVDRVIAASFAFGTDADLPDRSRRLQELPPDRDRAQERLPQVPQGGDRADRGLRRIRRPAGSGGPATTERRRLAASGTDGNVSHGRQQRRQHRRWATPTACRCRRCSNEVISVTGVYSFPYDQTPASPPTDQANGVIAQSARARSCSSAAR